MTRPNASSVGRPIGLLTVSVAIEWPVAEEQPGKNNNAASSKFTDTDGILGPWSQTGVVFW